MAKQVLNQTLMLAKSQSSYGTEISALTSVDLVETSGPAKLSLDHGFTPIELVAGALDQDASIAGMVSGDLTFSVPCRAAAADNPGAFGKCMKWSGMVEAEGTDGIFTYVFTSTLASVTDFTAWLYSGNQDASGSILTKAYNGIISPKWTFAANKPTVMECSAKVTMSAVPAVATQPTISKERTLPSAFIQATSLTLNGDSDYGVISGSIDAGQDVTLCVNPLSTYGMGAAFITNRKIKGSFKVYKELPATCDPFTAMRGNSIGSFALVYGTVPQKVGWTSTYCQLVSCKDSDENGIETWDIECIFVRNDLTVTVYTKS
jgi:hypothetical protein